MLKSKLGSHFLWSIPKDAIRSSSRFVLFGGLGSVSVAVLFFSVNVSKTSHSSGTSSVSSDSFGRPRISSLGGSSTE